MNRKFFLTLTLLAMTLGGVKTVLAQESPASPPAAAESATAESAEASAPEGEASDPMSSIFGAGFQKLVCDEFSSTPDGQVKITGRVSLKLKDMAIECNTLSVDPEKKIMTALGTPVKIEQGEVKSQCNKFTYYMEEKRSVLEQNPSIQQRKGDQVLNTRGDVIEITQDKEGRVGLNVKTNRRDPNRPVVIEQIDTKPANDGNGSSKKVPAQKVQGETGRMNIKMPSTN